MNTSPTENPGSNIASIQWVMNVAGALLLGTALAAGIGYFADAYSTPALDPVLQWPARWVFSVFLTLCALSALVCLLMESIKLKAGLLFWLTCNVAIYYLGCRWTLGSTDKISGWLTPLESAFHLPVVYIFWLVVALWLYLLLAILFTLLWPWLHRRLGLAEYLKMSCPTCGGHVKFSTSNLGRKIPCPHCETIIKLCRPDNLKMSCFFCAGHIEFPSHAIGEKMPCPHCKMDITLKEPA